MVFLAYAREDGATAVEVAADLAKRGVAVFKDLPRTTSDPWWRSAVRPSLDAADALLVLWSRHAAISPWVDQEVRAFTGTRVWLLLDATRTGSFARATDQQCRERGALCDIVGRLDVGGTPRGHHAPSDVLVGQRRRRRIESGWRILRAAARWQPAAGSLVEVSDGRLWHSSAELEFQRVEHDAYVATTSVTRRQYERFAAATSLPLHPSVHGTGRLDAPVVGVTWFEAAAYCRWLGGGLPSEAEWEAAAGGGDQEFATATGSLAPTLASYGGAFGEGQPSPQTLYPPNPAGFFGMCGNTWDWCRDAWGDHRAIRGGSWMDSERFCRVGARYRNAPIDRDCSVGFRVRVVARRTKGEIYGAVETGLSGFDR